MTCLNVVRLALVSFVLLAGCARPQAGESEIADSEAQALAIDNGLMPNGLMPNGLMPNGLMPNALSPNALASSALSPSARKAIEDPGLAGELSRMLLRYTVSCALSPNQAFVFSWVDSEGVVHDESYPGQLGIAPEWAAAPLGLSGQELVSACLAARTNWRGVQVIISMRFYDGLLPVMEDSVESISYPYLEGAFWGNLFAPEPYLRACYMEGNSEHSRAAERDCACGHIDADGAVVQCGIIDIVGPCSDYCAGPSLVANLFGALGQYYPACDDPTHGRTSAVITTALP